MAKQLARITERAPKGSGTARIYAEIRERILNLEFGPGTVLEEGALERLFDVSRTPIREAMIRLGSEGLIQLEPNRGATVAPIGLDTVRQFFEALDLTQRAVTRWAATRRSALDLEAITGYRRAFEQEVENNDPAQMNETNSQFHAAIAMACGNAYLHASYKRLFADGLRLSRLTMAYSSPDGTTPRRHLERVIEEHRAMEDAIRNEDATRAEALAQSHVRLFQSRVNSFLDHRLSQDIAIGPVEHVVSHNA